MRLIVNWTRCAAAATLFALLVATPAFGHAHLSKSTPTADATVNAPPEIVLVFTEPLERAFSNVEVSDAAGKRIETGKAQIKDNVMRLPLKPLPAGRYKVDWHVLSVDTHKSKGSFTFTVKP